MYSTDAMMRWVFSSAGKVKRAGIQGQTNFSDFVCQVHSPGVWQDKLRIARTSCATRIRHNPRARTTLRRPRPARFARRSVRVHLTSAVREPQEAHCQLCSSAASARLQPLSEEGVVPAHQGNDRSEPPLRPLDYLPLKNNVSHGHGSLAAHVSVFARAPGDVKSIDSHADGSTETSLRL